MAFAAGPPARVSVVGLSQVGFTMLLEMALWHRSFSGSTLVGIALVIAPTAWTLLRGGLQHKTEEEPLTLKRAA
jgi:drug/metabolite transporter (DMT)-like permease